jgi:hypothetical protein
VIREAPEAPEAGTLFVNIGSLLPCDHGNPMITNLR